MRHTELVSKYDLEILVLHASASSTRDSAICVFKPVLRLYLNPVGLCDICPEFRFVFHKLCKLFC